MDNQKVANSDLFTKHTVIEPSTRWYLFPLSDLWEYRELLLFLVWRDLKVRYKQTALGAAWIILQPLLSTFIFSFLFGGLLNIQSGNIPYPVFALSGLIVWNYFASSLNKSSTSLVNSTNLITKIYFPRLIIPIAGVLSGLVDFFISFFLLVVIMLIYQVKIAVTTIYFPILLLFALLTALGFSLWLSALNVRYRDINYLIPFFIQTWMYITPVIYPATLIPEKYEFLRVFLGINPMTGVIEGFRWSLLGSQLGNAQAPIQIIIISVGVTATILVSGILFFRYTERTFADII